MQSSVALEIQPSAGPIKRSSFAPVRDFRLAWREARPVVQLIFGVRFVLALALSLTEAGAAPDLSVAAAGVGSWVCATWVVYLLNGMADVETDRCNGNGRPVSSGLLSLGAAARCCVVLAAAALVLAAFVSALLVLLVVAMLLLGWIYSMGDRPSKNTLSGFFAVVILGGLFTYLAGWATAAAAAPDGRLAISGTLMVFAAGLSMWMGLAGTSKDFADVAGDRAGGRRTLPVLLGDRAARRATAGLTGALALGFAAATTLTAPRLLPVAGILVAGAAGLALCALTRLGHGNRDRNRLPYRVFMATQYLAHLTLLWMVLAWS